MDHKVMFNLLDSSKAHDARAVLESLFEEVTVIPPGIVAKPAQPAFLDTYAKLSLFSSARVEINMPRASIDTAQAIVSALKREMKLRSVDIANGSSWSYTDDAGKFKMQSLMSV